jgi:glutamyl-Q tRNA(Asp) synthetase
LLAATASYLDARHQGIAWRVRLDDLDEPRNQPGAARSILLALERHGLQWDGPVTRQSEQVDCYEAALASLQQQGVLFYCRCSRKVLHGTRVYPGTCRAHTAWRRDSAVRISVADAVVEFHDLIQGPQRQVLATSSGDFVLRRRDGIIAYQLATAADDGAAGITRVVRGRDLLGTTPRQILLIQRLGLSVPVYGHIPLLLNPAGQKLSKQNHAPPLGPAAANLVRVLKVLGLDPGPDAAEGGCEALLAAAVARFAVANIRPSDLQIAV